MGADYYMELLTPLYAGRRWIITADAAAAATGMVQRIVDAGAEAVLVIAGNEGTGPQPATEVFIVGTTGTTMMDGIRAFASALDTPSPELSAAIDAFDPTGEATVLSNYLISTAEICGRSVYGMARPEWKALEDKMIVDGVWDRAGVDRAPSAIVDPAEESEVHAALLELGSGDGVVLVADNTEGWHGGGEYTRYLAPGTDPAPTLGFFAEHSRRVRIMPFLRGVPCSIHGLVTSDRVSVFRPVEMLVYRRADSDEFVYTGMNTVWDPPAPVRDQMRDAARSVGALIRNEVGYRGAFGIDGVCTATGFIPTELNPRLTSGLGIQADSSGSYPMGDINRAIIAGADVDLRLDELERDIVAGADATRTGRWLRPITHLSVTETTEQPIAYADSSWKPADEAEATATMSLGPSPQGALVYVKLAKNHGLAPGGSIAEIAAASFAVSDKMWDTRIGDLVPATAPLPQLVHIGAAPSGRQIPQYLPLGGSPVLVVAGLLRRGDRLLLCHRHPDRDSYPDVWDLPGGHVEEGETPAAALARELNEELGISAEIPDVGPFTVVGVDDTLEMAVYLIDRWHGEPSNVATDEHDAVRWMRIDELHEIDLAHPSYPDLFRSVVDV
jgi:mutator protein MutT